MTINNRGDAWLTERGLDIETAIRAGLYTTSAPGGDATSAESADWIAIPYRVDGDVVNVKYRKLSEKQFAQSKGGKQVLWNRDVIRDQTLGNYPLIITEGEADALAALEAGFQRVVSVPGGAPNDAGTKRHVYIDEALADLSQVREIILATDSDEPGCNLRDDLIARLGKARCKTIRYPKQCKDLGDALRLYGVKGVRAAIDTAQPVPMPGVVELRDIPERPPLRPVKLRAFGSDFEKHIGLCRGHLSIWTGRANRGKTSLMRAVSWALAREQGWRIAVGSFEDDIRQTWLPAMKRLHAGRWPAGEDAVKAEAWIEDSFRFLLAPDSDSPTVPWLLEHMEGAVIRHGCNLIVIDPWTELDLQLQAGVSETEAVKLYLSAFKAFARRFNTHVAIIAHPRKPPDFGGTKRMPDGYDIAGSAHFTNKCDLGVTVEADPDVEGLSTVRVWKSRFKEEMGPTGDFHLVFDPSSRRFLEVTPEDVEAMRGGKAA